MSKRKKMWFLFISLPCFSNKLLRSKDYGALFDYHIYIYIYIHTHTHIVEHKVCSVTREPTQSSSRRLSSLKDSSVLLTPEW